MRLVSESAFVFPQIDEKEGATLGDFASGIASKNLVYPLLDRTLELPHSTGSSNEVEVDGFVEISYSGGHLLLMECFD